MEIADQLGIPIPPENPTYRDMIRLWALIGMELAEHQPEFAWGRGRRPGSRSAKVHPQDYEALAYIEATMEVLGLDFAAAYRQVAPHLMKRKLLGSAASRQTHPKRLKRLMARREPNEPNALARIMWRAGS